MELADGRTGKNGPSEGTGGQSEESGNESRPERPQGRRYNIYRRRPRGGGAVRGGRRRVEASDHEEYDTAEDGEGLCVFNCTLRAVAGNGKPIVM